MSEVHKTALVVIVMMFALHGLHLIGSTFSSRHRALGGSILIMTAFVFACLIP